jgi:drug/metabolite transporter (DMT)-like permease
MYSTSRNEFNSSGMPSTTKNTIEIAHQRRQRLIGIALMCLTMICFACLDSTAKYLNHYMETLEVVWARYTGGLLLALILSNPVSRPAIMRTKRPWLQIGRSILLLGSTLLNFFALRWLQLDQTTSILFATPFLVALMSGPILGEWVGWRRWMAICVGFAGVILVTRPGFGGIHPAALLSVASLCCYAFYIISTRVLASSDSNETTLFYSNLLGAVVMSLVVPFVWTTPDQWFHIALMLLMGALGSTGHYLLIIAHRLAPPVVLAPFMYTQLIWVIALGYFVFADLPNQWTVAGAAIVVASGLYLLHRERRVGSAVTATGAVIE